MLETLAAVAVISIGVLLASWGGYQIFTRIQEISETDRFLNELSSCEKLLKESINQIEYPFWYELDLTNFTSKNVDLPFYHGIKEDRLSLSFRDNGLIISRPAQSIIIFPGLSGGNFFIIGNRTEPRGIGITLSRGGVTYRLHCLLGGIPLFRKIP